MKNNFKFKFFSDIEQNIDIAKNIFEECNDINKFFVLRTMQVFDENKLVCEAQITIFNFNMESFDEFLEDFTDQVIQESLQLVERNYEIIDDLNLDFQELAVVKTVNCSDDVPENLKKYLQNNILDLTALYFCIDLKVILSNSRDKLFGTKTKKDNIIKRK